MRKHFRIHTIAPVEPCTKTAYMILSEEGCPWGNLFWDIEEARICSKFLNYMIKNSTSVEDDDWIDFYSGKYS